MERQGTARREEKKICIIHTLDTERQAATLAHAVALLVTVHKRQLQQSERSLQPVPTLH